MAIITKYEKIDNTHMRIWTYDETILVKNTLQTERGHLNNLISQDDDEKVKIMEKYNYSEGVAGYNAYFQARQDALDVLIDLFNNSTTNQTIPFLDEEAKKAKKI
jgi:hypothetical protein